MEKIYFRKKGACICDYCKKNFEKPLSEIKRNQKLNRQNFCSRTCSGMNNIKNFGDNKNKYDISKHAGRKKDKYTKFRYHFRNIRKRNKDIDVTIDDLKEQWEKQNGICVFSGIQLILSSHSKIKKNPIYSASLDRIDSSKGYIKGNIQWISRAINFMKSDMSDEMVNELIEILVEHKKRSHIVTFISGDADIRKSGPE
jgi:hypothetical protein